MFPFTNATALGESLPNRRAEFIWAELDLAGTFLQIAQTTSNAAIRKRSLSNAQRAHDSIVHLLEIGLRDGEERRGEIEQSLAAIKRQLEAAGAQPAQ